MEKGSFSPGEAELLKETLRLREKQVEDVMCSRVDLVWLSETTTPEEAADIIRESRQAFLPVSAGLLDNADRLLSTKAFFHLSPSDRLNWAHSSAVFHASFLPDQTSLPKALSSMKQKNMEAALVADEYGGINGMLTLQDIYSELAGRSVERNDTADWFCLKIADRTWIFDGICPMDFVREHCDWKSFDPDREGYDSNTLSGILCEELGSIPEINESVRIGEAELTALAVSRNRVTRIRIQLDPPVDSSAEQGKTGKDAR